MKKKLALLLATVMATTPLSALNISASGAELADVYADVYGIEVDFREVPQEADLENLTLLKGDGEEEVTVDWEADTGTKRTIKVKLDTDTKYTLSFGETEKTFQVKTVFEEDFSDTVEFADADIASGTPAVFSNDYGSFEISNGGKGSFISGGKVYVTNGKLTINGIDTNLDLADATLMADIKGYGKNWKLNPAMPTVLAPNEAQVHIHMYSREQSATAGGMRLSNATFSVGKLSSTYTAIGTTETYSNDSGAKFEFGKFTSESDDVVDLNNTVDVESDERSVALRTNGNSITGIVGDGASSYITTTRTSEEIPTTAGNFVIGDALNGNGVAVIDNIKITTYTENVAPSISGDLAVEGFNGDFDKLVLDFDNDISEVGPLSLAKIEVYRDLETEPMTITSMAVDSEDKTKLNIVVDGYSAGHIYKAVVPAGFGTPTLKTAEAAEKTYELVAQAIVVDSAKLEPDGIKITFDTEIETLTDASDLSSVTVEIGDANGENFVADSTATVSVSEKVLTVVPTTYTADKTYRVTIPAGFGNENILLQSEYVFTELLEKIAIHVTKISGNDGNIQVEFNKPLPPTTNTTGVTVYNANTDEQTIAKSITADGKLNIEFLGMAADTVYELFIPQNFGTDIMGTEYKVLKKFELDTIAFQNYENDGQSFGNVGNVYPKGTDPNGNTLGYFSGYGATKISNDEMDALENYTIEFDHQVLYNIRSTSTDNKYGKNVRNNGSFTFSYFRFNSTDAGTQRITIREYQAVYGETKNGASISIPSSESTVDFGEIVIHGDAEKNPTTGEFKIYTRGETFSEGATPKRTDGTVVTVSEKDFLAPSHYKIVKNGYNLSLYRNGSLLKHFANYGCTNKIGALEFYESGYAITTFDNIKVKTFKLIEEEEVVATNITLNTYTGTLAEQTALSGTFKLKNYTNETKNVKAIVAAYDNTNAMISADLTSVSSVNRGNTEDITFSLNNLIDANNPHGVSKLRLFLWNDMANKAEIAVYEFGE